MTNETSYDIQTDVTFDPLTLIDVPAIVDACEKPWWNRTLSQVDDAVIRLGILCGEFHWHKHDEEDEFFFVLEGTLLLDVERTRLWWSTVGGATGYDVVRGSLLDLQSTGGDFSDPTATETCLGNDQAATFFENPGDPSAGQGYWFLVREAAGSYDTGAPSQIGLRDAEIAASGNGCP